MTRGDCICDDDAFELVGLLLETEDDDDEIFEGRSQSRTLDIVSACLMLMTFKMFNLVAHFPIGLVYNLYSGR